MGTENSGKSQPDSQPAKQPASPLQIPKPGGLIPKAISNNPLAMQSFGIEQQKGQVASANRLAAIKAESDRINALKSDVAGMTVDQARSIDPQSAAQIIAQYGTVIPLDVRNALRENANSVNPFYGTKQ